MYNGYSHKLSIPPASVNESWSMYVRKVTKLLVFFLASNLSHQPYLFPFSPLLVPPSLHTVEGGGGKRKGGKKLLSSA